jgi:hypothetical protein
VDPFQWLLRGLHTGLLQQPPGGGGGVFRQDCCNGKNGALKSDFEIAK